MNQLPIPRYEFQHGADVTVKYLRSNDVPGKVEKDVFAVTAGGYKVYFEMMRLLPRTYREAQKPRKWGFGDILDPVSGLQLWTFRALAKQPPASLRHLRDFTGDLTTVRGEDNRTYVEFRSKQGELKGRFLLTELLPQWSSVATAPALPEKQPEPPMVPVAAVPKEVKVPKEPSPPPASRTTVLARGLAEEVLTNDVRRDLDLVADRRNLQMLEFVIGPLAGMARAPHYLRPKH